MSRPTAPRRRDGYDEMAYRQALQRLGLFPPIELDDIHRAYRLRAKLIHPDRFAMDEDARRSATGRIQELNAARDYAMKHYRWFDADQIRAYGRRNGDEEGSETTWREWWRCRSRPCTRSPWCWSRPRSWRWCRGSEKRAASAGARHSGPDRRSSFGAPGCSSPPLRHGCDVRDRGGARGQDLVRRIAPRHAVRRCGNAPDRGYELAAIAEGDTPPPPTRRAVVGR